VGDAVTASGAEDSRRGERGAVYLEFLIAFMPFFIFFLCLWQVSIMYSAKLIVDHAANAAARSAAVVWADDPLLFGGQPPNVMDTDTKPGTRATLVQTAAELAAASLIVDQTLVTLTVSYPDFGNGATLAPMAPFITTHMHVQVHADFNCKIMLANAIMCRPGKTAAARFTLPINSDSDFPYMGAPYLY
jgi:TadE-like protein